MPPTVGPLGLNEKQNWSIAKVGQYNYNLTTPTFSVSNPFQVNGSYYIFTDVGGAMFSAGLASSSSITGPYTNLYVDAPSRPPCPSHA